MIVDYKENITEISPTFWIEGKQSINYRGLALISRTERNHKEHLNKNPTIRVLFYVFLSFVWIKLKLPHQEVATHCRIWTRTIKLLLLYQT